MKKLVLMFVAMAAISFAACDNKPGKGADSDSVKKAATEQVKDAAGDAAQKVADDAQKTADDAQKVADDAQKAADEVKADK